MGLQLYEPTGISHPTSVDFSKRSINQPVHLVQYDKSLPILAVSLYNNGQLYPLPDDAIASIRLGKPDKTFVYNRDLGCNSNRTVVYFEVTQQMTLFEGEYYPIVEITREDKIANSSSIYIIVDRNPVQRDYIESTIECKELIDFRNEAATAAQNAKISEDNAKSSETNASNSASSASVSAENAATSASNAAKSETNAESSASNALQSEQNAATSASNASVSETNAELSASNAAKSETNASTSALNALQSEQNAATSASNASVSETNAESSASNALDSATAAGESEKKALNYMNAAKDFAENARNSAYSASISESNSDTSAKLSKSYAVGGSGIRDGEDANNSKYYSEQAKKYADEAQEIAGGNFIPNSEKGVVNGVAVLNANLAVEKAVADEDGNNIQETYAKKTEISEVIDVDSDLSETSMNPVQNKAITKALQEKADKTEVPKLVKVDGKTVFLSDDGVLSAKGGGTSIAPKATVDPALVSSNAKVTITWGDPDDSIID